jgi:hypothetical protein
MVMFLMALSLSGFGVALMCIAFAAATRDEQPQVEAKPAKTLAAQIAPPQFFVDNVTAQMPLPQPRVPLEVLLLQIERHVRLEQAAAESFIAYPTSASLHSRTTSPLVH